VLDWPAGLLLSDLRDRSDGFLLIPLGVALGDRGAVMPEDDAGRFDPELPQFGRGVMAELVCTGSA
jgi:hypothetical protein